jgi:aminoglycoside phosphotransferase (APT) family kinase protein
MVVRLPSASEYAQAVEKEHQWLPGLAPQPPLPIPVPLAKGKPSADYPHSWSIYQWLDGVTATADRIADPIRFTVDLAGFLAALQSVDAADGPQPGIHNWFRGGTLRTYDKDTQRALEELDGHVDVELAREIWANALDARWNGVDRWFHGDVAEGNLLLSDGQLAAVIDFGTCGVGDPACDLAIAWTLLTADGRQAFRHRLSVDAVSWARGRGWALGRRSPPVRIRTRILRCGVLPSRMTPYAACRCGCRRRRRRRCRCRWRCRRRWPAAKPRSPTGNWCTSTRSTSSASRGGVCEREAHPQRDPL